MYARTSHCPSMEISRHNELLAAFAQMQCRVLTLTDDVATLKAENVTLKTELAARDASILSLQLAHTQLQTVVALQDEHIASLTKELFGKSSEKAKSPPLPPAIPKPEKGRHEHGRKPIPDHLPRVEEIHDVPPEIRPGMVQIGSNRREILAWPPVIGTSASSSPRSTPSRASRKPASSPPKFPSSASTGPSTPSPPALPPANSSSTCRSTAKCSSSSAKASPSRCNQPSASSPSPPTSSKTSISPFSL